MLNLSNTSTVLSGTIGVNDGALVISDTISGSIPILVNSGTGALCGAGTANGPVTIASGVLAPGFPTGALTLNGNLTLSANSTLAIAVTGTAAGQYGQIVYGGTSASISGALTVSAPAGLQPETSFTIISSSTAVTGTFQGLPQNAYFYAAGYTWQINYSGGSGDNVVISIVGTGQEQQEKAIRAPDALAASSRAEAKTPSAKDASSGADRTDATGEGEAVPAVSISEIGETVARVDALVGARNSMTKVFFRYGPDLAYGKTSGTATLEAGGSASSVSMDLSALAPHTVYHIRCIAKGPRGTSVSPDVVFKTLPRFDMNGTGYSDILLSDSTGATTVLFIGNKVDAGGLPAITGTESAAGPWIPPGLSYRGEAEFYRNGTVGLIVTGSTPRQTELLTSGTDGWESAPLLTGTFAAPDTATVAGVGYFNGDGNPGLLLVGANRKLTFWRLDGLTVTAQKEGPALSPGFVVAGLDNLSGSENPEILIWNPETGITEVLTMKGTEVTSIEVGPTIPPGWQLMGDNDFTNAGTANWLLYNPASRATVIWTMQGARIRSVAPGPGISDGFAPLGTE
jgi:hypothetical protein